MVYTFSAFPLTLVPLCVGNLVVVSNILEHLESLSDAPLS